MDRAGLVIPFRGAARSQRQNKRHKDHQIHRDVQQIQSRKLAWLPEETTDFPMIDDGREQAGDLDSHASGKNGRLVGLHETVSQHLQRLERGEDEKISCKGRE
jgi:hypothetical protein